ncbi:conserved hypothetical protein [Cupriavidus taiwanensis]|uniref:Uncharacterized protein n=1 Tax=Cupriavidus taiwanensis TaxID=164546 RepID=A0A375DSE3_9BURK|nr:conserved hypothetical protein [Cupriavidus taiwanensis]SOY74590.1 conserved hypothetical protein [Cupriavidus taiwanensis]SOY74596.1 conserved hypothetical protein [Cupriavidus taiwanensis]SOY75522.1 conserved hypothetical protein [Cupriavidus taiwanensis]SOY99241.1 conserved hypothetical protein [Cupriavidus taiwanensis]
MTVPRSPLSVMTMPVPLVHEKMHQRTGGQEQVRQGLDDMGPVLCPEKVANDKQKSDRNQS